MSTCYYCGRESQWLCDEILAHVVDAKRIEDRFITCDRKICSYHRTKEGTIITCGRGRGNHKGCNHDTVDKCPDHAGKYTEVFEIRMEQVAEFKRQWTTTQLTLL